jgi:hypothetical protein
MGKLSLLTFSVIIDRYVVIPTIFIVFTFFIVYGFDCVQLNLLFSDYLSFLLLWFDTSSSLIVLFAFIFFVQNSL